MSDDPNKATFVLTGPREDYTGILGGRYGFKNGELTVDHVHKDKLKLILCTSYCCNIKGEAPLWKTVDGASVKITDMDKPEVETTSVKSAPTTTVESGDKSGSTLKSAAPAGAGTVSKE